MERIHFHGEADLDKRNTGQADLCASDGDSFENLDVYEYHKSILTRNREDLFVDTRPQRWILL